MVLNSSAVHGVVVRKCKQCSGNANAMTVPDHNAKRNLYGETAESGGFQAAYRDENVQGGRA